MTGFELRAARLNAGLSQRELAEKLGVGRETIRSLEAGNSSARPANAKKVADFFGVKVTDLMPLDREAA